MPHETNIYKKTRDGYIVAIEEEIFKNYIVFFKGNRISTFPKIFYRANIADAFDLWQTLKIHGPAGFISACKHFNLPFLELQERLIK